MSLAKRVLSATIILTLAGIIARLFSFISAPILTRYLGPAPYGTIALISTLVSLASTIALMGIDQSYTRYGMSGVGAAADRETIERYCWRFALKGSIVMAILAASLWYLISENNDKLLGSAMVVGGGTLLYALNLMSQARMRIRGEYGKLAIAVVVSAVMSVFVTIALTLWWRRDEWPLLVGFILSPVIVLIVTRFPKSEVLAMGHIPDPVERSRIARFGMAGAMSALMYWVVSSTDRWFIDFFREKEEVGVYAFIYAIASSGLMLNSAVISAWLPESIQEYETAPDSTPKDIGRLWGRLAAAMLLVWFALTTAGGDIVRLIADPKFHGGIVYIPWIAGGIFFYGLSHLANTGLVLKKNMKPWALWWVLGALVNLLLNIMAVGRWGALGAAIAGCLSYAFIAFGVLWSSLRAIRLEIPWERLGLSLIIVLIAAFFTHLPWHEWSVFSMGFKVPVYTAVSLLVMWIVGPEWTRKLLTSHPRRE